MKANTGILHPSFFVLLFPTRIPLTFSWPIPHGANCLNTAPLPLRRRPWRPPGLSIKTLNIQDGRGFELAQSIQTVERGGFDEMLITKTKIQLEAYSHDRLSYNMICLAARPSSYGGAQGDIGLMKRERPVGWGIESTRYHGPNVASCKVFIGLTRTPLFGAYLPPLTLE